MELGRCLLLASSLLLQIVTPSYGATSLVSVQGNQHDGIHGMWCPIWRNLLCGSDGITYWNECIFNANKQVKTGLANLKAGPCEEPECDDCEEEAGSPKSYEICGSNGQIFTNKCYFECYVDNYPLLEEVSDHCRRGFPTRDEMENATSEIYMDVFRAYTRRYIEIVEEYDYKQIHVRKLAFTTELNNEPYSIVCKKATVGDFSTVENFEPALFYSYNDVYGRTKFIFELGLLEMHVKRFRVLGHRFKLKGRLRLTVARNRLEIIADTSSSPSENYCPIIRPLSFKLVNVDNVTVVVTPALPQSVSELSLDGLIKEKLVEIVNDIIIPPIVQKLSEISCLKREGGEHKSCFNFFQSRMCF